MRGLLLGLSLAVAFIMGQAQTASAALPDLGVDPTEITGDIATGLGAWIGPMILLGFAVVVVVYGLKFFKSV